MQPWARMTAMPSHKRLTFCEEYMMKLELESITKFYGKYPALQNVSATLTEGVYGLLGPNGAGKTTFMKCMMGYLNFDGETGPYVQYTHARAASVLRKAGYDEITKDDIRALVGKADFNVLTDDASIALIKELDRYPTVIKSAAEKYEPSVVARYSMDVAHAFNTFYRDNQVIVDDDKVKTARLALFAVTKEIIKDSLSLLGIHSPERM